MADDAPPRAMVILALVAAGVAALSITLYLALSGTQDVTVGPSTYSNSAIGHDGLLALLKARGIEASASRGASLAKTRHGGVLVLAEPDFTADGKEMLRLLLGARNVLLVLPKWGGPADRDRPGWMALAQLLPDSLPQTVLDDAQLAATVTRAAHEVAFPANALGVAPHLADPPQLLQAGLPEPVVFGPDGVLVAHWRRGTRELTVLADPDVIANHGLASGNAAFALALIERARHGGPVVFDETIHGFTAAPDGRLTLVFAKPFLAATLDAVLACALLVWAGGRRFGTTLTRPAPFRPGKLALIDNITALLLDAGQQGALLQRYVAATIEDVATRLHAPEAASGPARTAWLAGMEQIRGVTHGAAALTARADAAVRAPARHFAIAEDIFHWKQEMLHGAARIGPGDGRYSRGNPQGGGGAG
jgi:hypothetical protein